MAAPLVDTDWLAAHLAAPDLLVLDLRSQSLDGGGRAAFEAGHVPGAVHSDYAADGWRTARGQAAGLLPPADALAALFGRLGITSRHHVVIVPAGLAPTDFSGAARAYWTLKVAGHANVSILDGGYAAWDDGRRPIERGAPQARSAPPYPVRMDESRRAGLAAVARAVETGEAALLDGRSAAYFEGREKSGQVARAGRLPGAVNVDHAGAFVPGTGRLKARADLERLFEPLPEGPVASYCNTGHLASTHWFILSEVLGRPGISLYDGSMSEWAEDPARPVATGAAG